MKTVGHEDAQMFFYAGSSKKLAKKVGGSVEILSEEHFYRQIPKSGLRLSTKISMVISDCLSMVKMIHLGL